MNDKLEEIFQKSYKKSSYLRNLEMALRGGEFHFIEFKNNIIKNSITKNNYYLSVRGKYKDNYFSFNSKFNDDLSNIIKINQKIINNNLIEYPFLNPIEYRDNNTMDIDFNNYNNLLLLELISKPIFTLLKKKFTINGFIYIKKGRTSPFSNNAPINSIINNNRLFASHKQNKIVLNLELTSLNKNIRTINKIFNTVKEVEEYLNKEIYKIEEYLKLPKMNNYTIKKDKIVFSSKSISKIMHTLKNYFSTSNYNENTKNPFRNKLNERIFSHKINIQDTAYHPLLQMAPFDEIGEERIITNIIKKGYLRELTSSYYESIKYKTPLTGHTLLNQKSSQPFSLYLKGGHTKLETILSQEVGVIYIDDLDINENIESLEKEINFSSKSSSVLYQNGKPQKLIENLELSISIRDLFMKVVEVTLENEELGMITPDIFISL